MTKTPTAGLWAGQTDEEELDVDYDTLDAVLALHVDGPLSASATARTLEVPSATVERVRNRHERSEHKRPIAWAGTERRHPVERSRGGRTR